ASTLCGESLLLLLPFQPRYTMAFSRSEKGGSLMTLETVRPRLTRRNLLRLSAASGAAVIAAACGAPASPTSAPAAQPTAAQPVTGSKAVELEVWSHADVLVDWMSDALKNFNFINQDITLKKVIYPIDDVHAKMLDALSSGQGVPDI